MDKNIIKNHLIKRFLSEEATPGISVTNAAKKESEKINKAGIKAVVKDSLDYNKGLKQDSETSKMATNKYNYTDDAEKTYHDEMEILNGQEMIEYSSEPGTEFKQRSKEAIVGSSRMGNEGKIGNAEETWGASKESFGKDLVKRVKDSSKKRADAEIQTYGMGDVQIPTGNKVQVATTAMGAGKPKGDTTKATQSASEKTKIKVVKEDNKNNNPQIKETMKRLKFKTPFNGFGNALKVIPEGYKVDKKEFEMTDGNETYRIRWEGTLTEGKATILAAKDNKLVNEDVARMKALFGYKSEDTLGLVKGKNRLDENAAFADIWKKSKALLGESEDIESETAATGDLDDAVSVAKEAKKHIEGSVSTEKGTQAPAPKKGEWEKNVKGQASEAKKHIEGTTSDDKGTKAPKPKEGEWEEISVPQAPEAKKHIESGAATHKATATATVVKENEEIENDDDTDVAPEPEENDDDNDNAPEPVDNYYKSDDDSSDEKEPSMKDIKREIPPSIGGDDDDVAIPSIPAKNTATLKQSAASGEYWIMQGDKGTKVPDEFLSIAADKTKKGSERAGIILNAMQEKANAESEVEPVDEYGDEHHVSTTDALKGMK